MVERTCPIASGMGVRCQGQLLVLDKAVEIHDNDANGDAIRRLFRAWKCLDCGRHTLLPIEEETD